MNDRVYTIAYCIPSLYYPSGMERVLSLKANYFAGQWGYNVHIILSDGIGKEPYYSLHPKVILHQLNINYDHLYGLSLHQRAVAYCRKQAQFRKKLNACLCAIKPDITISLLRRDINLIHRMTDGSIKMGEIHFSKYNYRDFSDNSLPAFLQKAVRYIWMKQLIRQLRRLKAFVVLSHEDAEAWTELDNVVVIHNPLSFYPENVSTCTAPQVIAVGRYMPQKGFDLLIKAWSLVSPAHPDWVLRIYGDGMRGYLQELIDRMQLSDSCVLEPSTDKIVDKYQESSVFVLSSRYEGFGMVITEAMACGLPTVAFACPCGPKDIIRDGEDGFLVERENIEQLAGKIRYLIEHADIRKEMGHRARINVERFKMEGIAQQWRNLFDTLLIDKRQNT